MDVLGAICDEGC